MLLATTAATSWTRSKSTSSCRAARGSDWRISERNEDGREMDSSYASARMEILRTSRGKELSGFRDWLEKFSGWLSP